MVRALPRVFTAEHSEDIHGSRVMLGEIKEAVRALKGKKSPGVDQLVAEAYQHLEAPQLDGLAGRVKEVLRTRGPSVEWGGKCKCGSPQSAQILADLPQIGYILVIFFASAESPPRSSVSGSDLYISDMPDLIPRSIHRKSVAFGSFTWNRQLPLMRARSQISQIFFHNRIYINLFRQIWTLRCT